MLLVYKQSGELLSELVTRVRLEQGIGEDVSLTYAGRLDPLVEGVVVILTGDDVHQKDQYAGLTKRYTFDILFGIGTDTHDPLGRIEQVHSFAGEEDEIIRVAETFLGITEQQYPLYSSKTVQGTPLFAFARAGISVEQPIHKVEMFGLKSLGMRKISGGVLADEAQEKVARVHGDFRQEDIGRDWKSFGEEHRIKEFTISRFVVTVGSGFYVRQLAHDLGERLGIPALAWWIRRDAVGEYTIERYGN